MHIKLFKRLKGYFMGSEMKMFLKQAFNLKFKSKFKKKIKKLNFN